MTDRRALVAAGMPVGPGHDGWRVMARLAEVSASLHFPLTADGPESQPSPAVARHDGWVWFDLENTPHVLFLEPFIWRLKAAGWDVRVTAKPQSQTVELASRRNIAVSVIGGGDFAGGSRKVAGGLARALRLAQWALARGRPRLLVSGSRSASLAAWLTRVPAVGLLDYEHAEQRALALGSRTLWFPDLLRVVRLPPRSRRVARYYAGLKENLYLDAWDLDREAERAALGVAASEYLVVARPPAATAHYASATSERLWHLAVSRLLRRPETRVIASPRNEAQRAHLREQLRAEPRVRVLAEAVTGPALVAAADLVLGGGGTMNREAAVLGVPVWSVFTGPAPHIDESLSAEGRLRWVRTESALDEALADPLPCPRERRGPYPAGLAAICDDIAAHLGMAERLRI